MAKIYGLFGSMTGKVADVVMSVRGGEQIVRRYQPSVLNPNTTGQVEARAKLKLISQLSAVMAAYIAIPRRGNISSRNMFVKKNYGIITYADDTASATLTSIQLTDSVVGLPNLIVSAGEASNTISVRLYAGVLTGLDRVVYVAFVKQADNKLRLANSIVVSATQADSVFSANLNVGTSEPIVVYAYGVRDNTEAARVVFGDMQAIPAETVAKLIVSRTLTEADITLTETKAAEYSSQA